MNQKSREGFYTLWTAAILVGLVLCVFALLFTSCVKGTGSDQTTEDTTTTQADASGEPAEETPAADTAVEETPVTDAAAEGVLTTEETPAAEEALTE